MVRFGWRWIVLCAVLLSAVLVSRTWGQESGRFFPTTSQTLDNQYGFLDFWNEHAGVEMLGEPLTPIVFEANVPTQYFERGRLEQRDGTVVTGHLGRERTRWRRFAKPATTGVRGDSQRFKETGYSVAGPFLRFWKAHNGATLFGVPISDPVWEQVNGANIRVQYFERARLEHYPALPQGRDIQISALGREVAVSKALINPEQKSAVQVAPEVVVDQRSAAFGQLAPPTPTPIPPTATPVPPTPVAPTLAPVKPAAPKPAASAPAKPAAAAPKQTIKPTAKPAPVAPATGKVIDVDVSAQQLVAFEDGKVVFTAPIATGKDGFNTPTGTFKIYSKTPKQTMRGNLGGESWVVPNVPNVMYINGSVALHGAYWHNLFGSGVRLSHGCINLPLDSAAWLYKWAPVGTTVVVHQ